MKRSTTLFLLLIALLGAGLLAGCGGNGDPYDPKIVGSTGGTPPPAPDFALQVSPAKQNLSNQNPGQMTSRVHRLGVTTRNEADFTVTLTQKNGFKGTINLTVTNPNSSLLGASFDQTQLAVNGNTPATTTFRVVLLNSTSTTGDQTFTVTATSGSISHTVKPIVTLTGSTGTSPAANYAIFSTGPVSVTAGSSTISVPQDGTGNVYGAGSVSIDGNSSVDGFCQSVQTVSVASGSSVMNGVQNHISPLVVPTLDTASVKSAASAKKVTNGAVNINATTTTITGLYTGNVTITDSTVTVVAPCYIEGSLNVSNSTTQTGTLYAEGPVVISFSTTGDSNPLGLVCLASGVNALDVRYSTCNGVTFCPNGAATIELASTLDATLVANGATVSGCTVERDANLVWPLH